MLSDVVRAIVGAELALGDGPSIIITPPTTRVALVLLASWESAVIDGPDSETFWQYLSMWLGEDRVAEAREKAHTPTFVKTVIDMVRVGVPQQAKTETDETDDTEPEDVAEQLERIPWASMLADFWATYHKDPLDVVWPTFLSMSKETLRIRRAAQAQFVEAYSAMKSDEGSKTIKRIFREAYPHAVQKPRIKLPEWMNDEWQAKQIALARATKAKAMA